MKNVFSSETDGVTRPITTPPTVYLDRGLENFPALAAHGKDAPRAHLGFLDGLRGLAVLYVVVYHLWLSRHAEHLHAGMRGLLTNWLQFGHLAVDVFIVLSGFCLMLPVARRGELTGGTVAFFKKRARRILPPFRAAMVFGLIMNALAFAFFTHGRLPGLSVSNLLANMLLLQDVHPACNTINGAFWSVAVEWKIYFLFPALVWIWKKYGVGTALGAAVRIGYGLTTALYLAHRLYIVSPDAQIGVTLTCPWYVTLFGLGMWAAARAFGDASLKAWSGKWTAGFAASVALLVGTLALFPHGGNNAVYTTHWPAIDGAAGLATAFALLWLGVKAQQGTATAAHRVLAWRPLAFFGTIGYSVYLTHLAVLHGYMALYGTAARHGMSGAVINAALFGAGLPLIVLVAYGFFVLFERPFLSTATQVQKAAQTIMAYSATAAANG